MPLVVFRADASAEIGGGHVHRCLAVATAFRERGWGVAFATIPASRDAVPSLMQSGAEILMLDGAPDGDATAMKERWPGGPDAVLVDHYCRDVRFESSLCGWAGLLAVIDDLPNRKHDADVFIDPAPGRTGDELKRLVPESCIALVGPAYAPLRPEWPAARGEGIGRDRSRDVARIVVSLGAVDAENFTALVVDALKAIMHPAEVVVVLGPAAPHRAAVADAIRGDNRFKLVVDPAAFARLMAESDIAIGAAGSTSWERCCVGLPSVAIVVADNQLRNAAALDRSGAAIVVGMQSSVTADAIRVATQALIGDAGRRTAMARAAAALCDGEGASRIADAVVAKRALRR